MVKVQRQAKKKRRGLKQAVVKTQSKLKRAAPSPKRVKQERPAPGRAGNKRREQAPAPATRSQVRAAVVAGPGAEGQNFPLFWPALGWMRMWLGPRKTPQAAGH
jgi:hypothetical protein